MNPYSIQKYHIYYINPEKILHKYDQLYNFRNESSLLPKI